MHAFFSISLACLLFLQAVSGWCWQCPHDCMPCGDRVAQPTKSCSHDCDHEQQSEGPCKCNLECHGICTYLQPEKTQVDSPVELVSWDIVAITTASTDLAHGSALAWELAQSRGELEPPLRLHLFHQVLLI